MKFNAFTLAAIAVMTIGSAHADTYSTAGTLTLTDAVFNRPTTLTSLSGVGTAVHYDTLSFSGATAGAYNFRMVATAPGTFDTFLALYAGVFNPASPLTNLVALNDDFGGVIAAGSGFTFTLSATTAYTVVSTAFSNTGVGTYLTTVTPVPEPATYGLMALGLAGIGGLIRRRRQPG